MMPSQSCPRSPNGNSPCTLEQEVRLFEMAVPKESVGFYMELGFVQMELVALQAYIKHDA